VVAAAVFEYGRGAATASEADARRSMETTRMAAVPGLDVRPPLGYGWRWQLDFGVTHRPVGDVSPA
jgi:hypothetical protein